jgi:copper chaperone
MLSFEIPEMSCGHCVRAITEAVHAADPAARVEADLPSHRVQVETTATREAVVAQLVEAGYAPL